jgi:hypothetical protein
MALTTSDIKDFTHAVFGDWLARMSGPLSVPAAVSAPFVPNDVLKILLGVTAVICFWVTAYRIWKPEHDRAVQRDQQKRQLLDDIAVLREKAVEYRIAMEAAHRGGQFDETEWQRKYDDLQTEIASKIEQLSSKAEASTFLKRGNISRVVRPNRPGHFIWPVLIDVCIHDQDYLLTFIHDYSRGKKRAI